MINDDCHRFQTEWNNKPVTRTEGKGRSLGDMRFQGQATKGTYETQPDECLGITVEDIVRFYGIKGQEKEMPEGMTGAGTVADDADATTTAFDATLEVDEDDDITAEEWSHIEVLDASVSHKFDAKPVSVPKYHNPFEEDADAFYIFKSALEQVEAEQVIPRGYHMHLDE
jgi:hypothetical protein